MCSVNRTQICVASMNNIEETKQGWLHSGTSSPVEDRPQSIRAWGTGSVHPINGGLHLLGLKRGHDSRPIHHSHAPVELGQVKSPSSGTAPPQQVGLETVEGPRLHGVIDYH
jgi:hypothetical protein